MDINNDSGVTTPTSSYFQEAADALGGDPATELAAMLLEHVKQSRDMNRHESRAEEDYLRLVQRGQVAAMRAEADRVRAAGKARGFAGIASGVLTIGSGAAGASGDSYCKTSLEGSAKVTDGSGDVLAADYDRLAKRAQADATEFDHRAGESDRRLEALGDRRAQTNDLEDDAFEHLKAVQQKEAETNQTLATWRA